MSKQTDHITDVKKKATKMVDSFYQHLPLNRYVITSDTGLSLDYDGWTRAKECALIAVNEILRLDAIKELPLTHHYWQEVKHEIEKL
jgi:hypothetical protein